MPEPGIEPDNIIWEQRIGRESTAYEKALSDALGAIFVEGVHDLDGIVTKLNEMGVRAEGGDRWSADLFKSEMARLGNREF